MRIYFESNGRISAAEFRKYVLVTSFVGTGAAYLVSIVLFGTYTLPFVPLMPNPDPVHQMLYSLLPLLFSAPLFIKRQHDRNRTPMFLSLIHI